MSFPLTFSGPWIGSAVANPSVVNPDAKRWSKGNPPPELWPTAQMPVTQDSGRGGLGHWLSADCAPRVTTCGPLRIPMIEV